SVWHQINLPIMNIFRLLGDMSHLAGIVLLLHKIWTSRSVSGISGKSQVCFCLVFLTRYLDMFTSFVSLYNTLMKMFFISSSIATVFMMYGRFKSSYDSNHDTFELKFLIAPAALLALVANHEFSFLEVLWTFSIYLESVAILPQLFLITKTGEAETITSHYLFALGAYRGLYVFNWIYRYFAEGYLDLIVVLSGCLQTCLYADFFYLYVTKVLSGRKISLPA
ncbi:hypothetical protein BOX15_Mlig007604g1, partial [Macrostomum lignano]